MATVALAPSTGAAAPGQVRALPLALSHFSITPRAFGVRGGATIRFALSRPAIVVVSIRSIRGGDGGGEVMIRGKAGANSVHFDGSVYTFIRVATLEPLTRHLLAPGLYRVRYRAYTAGAATRTTRSLRFRVTGKRPAAVVAPGNLNVAGARRAVARLEQALGADGYRISSCSRRSFSTISCVVKDHGRATGPNGSSTYACTYTVVVYATRRHIYASGREHATCTTTRLG